MSTRELLDVLLLLTLGFIAGWLLGYRLGEKTGRAMGWLDHYFDQAAKDKARRDKLGQFKSKDQ